MSDLDVCFAEALAYTASLTPGVYTTFQRHLDPSWIEEAFATTGTATLGFGEMKTDMLQRLEAIRSKSPDTVTQELWGLAACLQPRPARNGAHR